MAAKRILVIQGHPDGSNPHFGHALADSYAEAAERKGHDVRRIVVARLDFPVLHSKAEWERGECAPAIRQAQEAIRWAEHVIIVYPLWLGSMPALLKGFFEQVFRPDFAFGRAEKGPMWSKLLQGRSARVIVTTGMPGLIYRWFYLAHSLRSLERNILAFVGFGPIRANVIGRVEDARPDYRNRWLEKMRQLGERAA